MVTALQNNHWNTVKTKRLKGIKVGYDLRNYIGSYRNVMQKQLSRGYLRKRCSGKIQQIYRRTPIPKFDFNKVALNLLNIFRVPFPKNTPGWLFLVTQFQISSKKESK